MDGEAVIRSWLPSARRSDLNQDLLETAVVTHFRCETVELDRFYVLTERTELAELCRFLAPPHVQLQDFYCWHFPTFGEAQHMFKHLILHGENSGVGCWIVEYAFEESLLIAAQ